MIPQVVSQCVEKLQSLQTKLHRSDKALSQAVDSLQDKQRELRWVIC